MTLTRLWQRALAAMVGGLLLAASFPPYDLPWLAPPALALLTLACHGARVREGVLLGFIGGLLFFSIHLQWASVIGDDAWSALAVYCALWIALVGGAIAGTSSLRWWPAVVPLLWVAQEAGRDRVPLGGFPWGRLAFGQTSTLLTPYAAVAGAPAVTFAVSLIGALIAWLAISFRTAGARALVATVVAIVAISTLGGLVPRPVGGQLGAGGAAAYVTAAVVQGSVPHTGMTIEDDRMQVLDNHVRVTKQLAVDIAAGRVLKPDLVIWPESSSDVDPLADPVAAARIQSAVDAVGVPVLVGAVVADPTDETHNLNAGIVWGPTGSANAGPGQFYVKQHPVPFGEWVPLRGVLTTLISRFSLVPKDFAAGAHTGVMQVGPALLGDVICFEVAYDDLVRNAVTGADTTGELAGAGGRILSVQTNNATYGGTGQLAQQIAMSQLRAVEHGRTVLVAATSGITAIISPDGSMLAQLPESAAGALVISVPLRDDVTVADRVGAWPEVLISLAAGVVLAWVIGSGLRRRRAGVVGSFEPVVTQEPVP